jgi:hypothetical protein
VPRRITTTPFSSPRDPPHRVAQRPAEFRRANADHVAQGVLQVHADQRRQRRLQVPADEREVHVPVDVVLVAVHLEAPNSVFTTRVKIRSTERSLCSR